MDGRTEALDVYDSWTSEQTMWVMGSKLNLWQLSFFALSETDINADAADRWLAPKSTLAAEGIKSGTKLVLKIKYFKYPKKLRDPVAVYLFFAQTRAQVIRGTIETTEAMAFKLASLHLTADQASFRPQDFRVGFLSRDMGKWIPHGRWTTMQDAGLDMRYVEKRIYSACEKIKDMNKTDALYAYLKTVKVGGFFHFALFLSHFYVCFSLRTSLFMVPQSLMSRLTESLVSLALLKMAF
jgi:hypothetical protein